VSCSIKDGAELCLICLRTASDAGIFDLNQTRDQGEPPPPSRAPPILPPSHAGSLPRSQASGGIGHTMKQ
jgi:hypothetical protein